MIDLVVRHIVDQLNAYVNLRTGVDDRVAEGSLLEQNGNVTQGLDDKVVLSLVNLEEDRVGRSMETYHRQPDDRHHKIRPEIRINLYLLFIANLNTYSEALKALAHVIAFFQRKSYFDYAEIPALADLKGKLVFELQSLTFEQINHLWGALGIKYLPSVLYKVRVTSIQDSLVEAVVAPVEEIRITEAMP